MKSCFVHVVNMKIFIAAFLCTSMTAVYSTGSTSTLFKSKLVGGQEMGYPQTLPFLVTIFRKGTLGEVFGMGSFYNEEKVITSKTIAKLIKGKEREFWVQGGDIVNYNYYGISCVTYTSHKASKRTSTYGILKLETQAKLGSHSPVQLMDIEDIVKEQTIHVISGGWGLDKARKSMVLKYLRQTTMLFQTCYSTFAVTGNKLHSDEVCTHSIPHGEEYFSEYDSGTPLYYNNTLLVGVSNALGVSSGCFSIFSLIGKKKEEIEEFACPNDKSSSEQTLSSTPSFDSDKLKRLNLKESTLPQSSSPHRPSTTGSYSRMKKLYGNVDRTHSSSFTTYFTRPLSLIREYTTKPHKTRETSSKTGNISRSSSSLGESVSSSDSQSSKVKKSFLFNKPHFTPSSSTASTQYKRSIP